MKACKKKQEIKAKSRNIKRIKRLIQKCSSEDIYSNTTYPGSMQFAKLTKHMLKALKIASALHEKLLF